MKVKYIKIFIFWLITWTIYNTIVLFEEIYLLANNDIYGASNILIYFYLSAGYWIYTIFMLGEVLNPPGIEPNLMQGILFWFYSALLVSSGFWFWWHKQTISRAFLLAASGAAGPLLFTEIFAGWQLVLYSICAMCIFYALLAILNIMRKRYLPNLGISWLYFWRRPWE